MKVEGTVERKSQYGIMVGKQWFNESKQGPSFLGNVATGDYVVMEYEEKPYNGKVYRNVSNIENHGQNAKEADLATAHTEQAIGHSQRNGQRDGMIVKEANAAVLALHADKIQSVDDWKALVKEHMKGLESVMDELGW